MSLKTRLVRLPHTLLKRFNRRAFTWHPKLEHNRSSMPITGYNTPGDMTKAPRREPGGAGVVQRAVERKKIAHSGGRCTPTKWSPLYIGPIPRKSGLRVDR